MVQKSRDLQRFLLTYISQLVRDFWNTGRRVWQKIWLTRWVATPPGKMKGLEPKDVHPEWKKRKVHGWKFTAASPKNHPIFFLEKSSEPNLHDCVQNSKNVNFSRVFRNLDIILFFQFTAFRFSSVQISQLGHLKKTSDMCFCTIFLVGGLPSLKQT